MDLYYKIKEPKIKNIKNPLILLLHGYGSNEEDLFSFAPELPEDYYIVSARAPYDLMYGSYAWYAINFDANENKFFDIEQAKLSRDVIVNFIDELIQNYPIDKDNITIIGFSQGSSLGYAVALSYPQKVKRLVALSGFLTTDILIDGFEKNNFKNMKLFVSHGTVDQIIPVEWARKCVPILNDLKIKHEYKEYPIGHGISPQNFYDFRNWLKNNN